MAAEISTSLTIVSLCFGYAQTVMWVSAMIFYTWIPISVLSSNGLAIDFVILNAGGYFLLGLQDSYGTWFSGASYHYDVHISDMIISCCGLFYGTANLCSIYLLPRSTPKRMSVVLGIIPLTCMYLGAIFVAVTFQDFDYTMKTCGTIKGIESLIAYIPLMHNNYKNKSTYG